MTRDRFGEPGLVDYRNPNLAEALKTLRIVQRFGFGIFIARKLLAEAGHPQPEFEVSDTTVRVTVRAKSAAS